MDRTQFDNLLKDRNAIGVVLEEELAPLEGSDTVIFPATFAAQDKGPIPAGYCIDKLNKGGNRCLIDSIQSQGNRLEPLFGEEPYRKLIPQITIKWPERIGRRPTSILELPHRAADGAIRHTSLSKLLTEAFKDMQDKSDTKMAKLCPTSIPMGSWDSQMTQIKKARMFWSVIEAFDVSTLTRRSQLIPPVDYRNEGLIKGDYDMDEFSGAGLSNVPSTKPDVGGVIVHGKIRRQMSVQFEAIRKLRGDTEEETLALRRYILGLCLVLFTVPVSRTLRSGCTLVRKSPDACTTYMGYSDGTRVPFTYSHDEILAYATDAAQAFGVGPDQEVAFDSESVEAHMIAQAAKKEAKKAKKNGKGKGKTPVEEAVQIPVVDEDEEASSEE